MQEIIILIEKSNQYFSNVIESLRSQSEIKIKDAKKIAARSSYYSIVIKKIYIINKALRELNPQLYLAEPAFSIAKSEEVFTSLKKCEFIDIESKKDFFLLRFKNKEANHG